MLTQEESVHRVLELKRQGRSITEIAAEMGYHPATVSKWLKQGGPPPARRVDPSARAIDERWAKRIDALIAPPPKLLASSVFEIVKAEGLSGSYPSVVRYLRDRRGPRFLLNQGRSGRPSPRNDESPRYRKMARSRGHAAFPSRCSSRSAIQTLMTDWRVTPRRLASRSSFSIIHEGKSTFTRRCSRPGRRAAGRSRAAITSSPASKRSSNSSVLILLINLHLFAP